MKLNPVYLLLLSTALFSTGIDSQADEQRPNVLFIAVDDLNDMVGFLNEHPGVKTPNMDRLAVRGVSFSNAHCAAPGCAPSRTALLTGLSPSNTGVYINKDDWRNNKFTKDVVTLPDSFRAAGYTTKGGGKIYHAFSFSEKALTGYMDAEPWDEYFPSKQRQLPVEREPKNWPVNSSKEFYGGHFDWAPLNIEDDEMGDGQVVSWAEKQLSIKHDKPLFLAVGIYRPHVPWWTPEKYFELHPLEQVALPDVAEDDLDDLPTGAENLPRRHWQNWVVENQQWEKAVQGYLASMTFADAMVGRLIAALEKGPMANNTVIVLWSDHGYHLGHKQHWEKFTLWEQATHVPLVFVDTRLQQKSNSWSSGARCDQPASLLDVYPTLVEICGLDEPERLDGTSLVPLLRDPDRHTGRAVVTTHDYMNHAVRSKHWRYIRYADGTEELYDHKVDPKEFNNLANLKQYTQTKVELAKWLPRSNQEPMNRPKQEVAFIDDFSAAELDGRLAERGDWKFENNVASCVADLELYKKYKNHGPILKWPREFKNAEIEFEMKASKCQRVVFTLNGDGHVFRVTLADETPNATAGASKVPTRMIAWATKSSKQNKGDTIKPEGLPDLPAVNEKWVKVKLVIRKDEGGLTIGDFKTKFKHDALARDKNTVMLTFAHGELAVRNFRMLVRGQSKAESPH